MNFNKVLIEKPEWQILDNFFLKDSYITIKYNNELIGEIVMTKYDWNKAIEFHSYRHWLCQEHTYFGDMRDYLFNHDDKMATLPLHFNEYSQNTDPVLIIDHIKLKGKFQTEDMYNHIINEIITEMSGEFIVMLFMNWSKISETLDKSQSEVLEMFFNHSMHAIDNNALLRYMDNSISDFESEFL